MFTLVDRPIDIESSNGSIQDRAAGGMSIFEGRVREINDGKAVRRLEYEAYPELVISEGKKIIAEAKQLFNLEKAEAIHRTGMLEIGEVAVWVGVSARHRDDSFKACRYIIDEIKHRLPIWKKEYYTNGDAIWVDCKGCHSMADYGFGPEQYYSRQNRLAPIAIGKDRLNNAKIAMIGAGGIGCPTLMALAGSGIGQIDIYDHDVVDASNLSRQFLFDASDVGKSKALVAAKKIRSLNPFIKVNAHNLRVDRHNVEAVVRGSDLVVDGCDNFQTMFAVGDACYLSNKPLFAASIHGFEACINFYAHNADSGCHRCQRPEEPEEGCGGSCSEVGVMGFSVGILGSTIAAESIKYLLDPATYQWSGTRLLNTWDQSSLSIEAPRAGDCPLCGGEPRITEIEDGLVHPECLGVSLEVAETMGLKLCSVSSTDEFDFPESIKSKISFLQLDDIEAQDYPMALVCSRGVTAGKLAAYYRSIGKKNVYYIDGSIC